MNSAEKCRSNGWGPGTRLVGDEGHGPTVIEITAVGREGILAGCISQAGEPSDFRESSWALDYRDWKEVQAEAIDEAK